MIQVIGILVNPLNQPIQTTIRVSTIKSCNTVLSATALIITGSDGTYDFSLINGTFLIELLIDDEYNEGVAVIIDVVTPSVIDLPSLLENHVAPSNGDY